MLTRLTAPIITASMPLFLALSLAAVLPVACFGWTGKAVSIYDGDTFTVVRKGKTVTIRLYGLDCPKPGQPYHTEAKEFTASRVLKKNVWVAPVTGDRYGRTVARVYVHGRSLNRALVGAGLAWWYPKHAKRIPELQYLEGVARKSKIGIWSQPNPIPPWEWEKRPESNGTQ